MALYEKPVRFLFRDMIDDMNLQVGKQFTRREAINWFEKHYPLVKKGTITAHLIRLSTNAPSRHHYSAKPVEDDLFYQIDSSHFRLYNPQNDPAPIYGTDFDDIEALEEDDDYEFNAIEKTEFAYERDLQNFLAKNLHLIEPQLKLFEEEGITGIEFPAGGRRIDILALDGDNKYVVIELKVSRGYDRVIGQILRYMGWIEENMAEDGQGVRGIIIARNITNDLKLACSRVADVQLFEYELSIALRQV